MDLELYASVLWRFRRFVAAGLAVAVVLALMSYVTVRFDNGTPALAYRDAEKWESLSTLFFTSRGFPWGSVSDEESTNGRTPSGVDASRLTGLAVLYIPLATSDDVLRLVRGSGKIDGVLQAFPVFPAGDKSADPLPMVTLSAIASSPQKARQLGRRHIRAFLTFLDRRQSSAGIPPRERLVIEIVRKPQRAVLLEGRGLTRPIVVFLGVIAVVVGIAFVRENLRRGRVEPAGGLQPTPMAPAPKPAPTTASATASTPAQPVARTSRWSI